MKKRKNKCDYCKKGTPQIFNPHGQFCNQICYGLWLTKKAQEIGDQTEQLLEDMKNV